MIYKRSVVIDSSNGESEICFWISDNPLILITISLVNDTFVGQKLTTKIETEVQKYFNLVCFHLVRRGTQLMHWGYLSALQIF